MEWSCQFDKKNYREHGSKQWNGLVNLIKNDREHGYVLIQV